MQENLHMIRMSIATIMAMIIMEKGIIAGRISMAAREMDDQRAI